ncbi:hypothetical protein HS1genome_2187 [Sulfodiicoccus acidiphilus]|uniref:Sodium/calcium exchanger membrane region domain-containing protein n=1 Tax=Sulfodiicoccus acidiphilus TaxID=1670455 RepID=A0A348B6J6_9CREN|nr:sodium:calcium antiporter [Sulfodiicoccus acidiphilus]BBD73798.1 hypothetical protein HS1genome_2187 [Sulfodiicoccus acidiphilus]GGU03650.1 hypothetical protein GCM10007116_20640 [Sulfodiicoccus acidiphilus]
MLAVLLAYLVAFGAASMAVAAAADMLEDYLGQGFTGGVLLGLLSSLPETIFVASATMRGDLQVALGSAVGGNLILLTLGAFIVVLVYFLKWRRPVTMREDFRVELSFMGASSVVLFAVVLAKVINVWFSIAFVSIYAVYVFTRVRRVKERPSQIPPSVALKAGLLMGSAAAALIFLSKGFVQQIEETSLSVGIPPIVLAMLISPVAAEMEESLSALAMASRFEGGGSMALVSFMGSKIENMTVLLAIVGLGGAAVGNYSVYLGAVLLANAAFTLTLMDGKVTLREAGGLLLAYVTLVAFSLAFR